MRGFLAGMMGIVMGVTSFFHSQGAIHPTVNTNLSGTPVPSGKPHGRFGMEIPKGDRPFFGIVTQVNGSTLTIEITPIMDYLRNPSTAPTVTSPAPKTLTVILDSSTTYSGGPASDIAVNTKIAGFGKLSSDGSLEAVKVQINPTFPTMGPRGFGRWNHQQRPTPTP